MLFDPNKSRILQYFNQIFRKTYLNNALQHAWKQDIIFSVNCCAENWTDVRGMNKGTLSDDTTLLS